MGARARQRRIAESSRDTPLTGPKRERAAATIRREAGTIRCLAPGAKVRSGGCGGEEPWPSLSSRSADGGALVS